MRKTTTLGCRVTMRHPTPVWLRPLSLNEVVQAQLVKSGFPVIYSFSLSFSLSLCVQVVCRNNATANTPISWDWFEGRKITLKYQSNPKKMPKIIWLPSNPPPKHVHISHIYICVCMCLCVCACMCIYTYNFILHYIIVYHIILDCVK